MKALLFALLLQVVWASTSEVMELGGATMGEPPQTVIRVGCEWIWCSCACAADVQWICRDGKALCQRWLWPVSARYPERVAGEFIGLTIV